MGDSPDSESNDLEGIEVPENEETPTTPNNIQVQTRIEMSDVTLRRSLKPIVVYCVIVDLITLGISIFFLHRPSSGSMKLEFITLLTIWIGYRVLELIMDAILFRSIAWAHSPTGFCTVWISYSYLLVLLNIIGFVIVFCCVLDLTLEHKASAVVAILIRIMCNYEVVKFVGKIQKLNVHA